MEEIAREGLNYLWITNILGMCVCLVCFISLSFYFLFGGCHDDELRWGLIVCLILCVVVFGYYCVDNICLVYWPRVAVVKQLLGR